jgi:transposase
VKLSVEKLRVDIFVEYGESTGACPECGAICRVYDRSPGRVWRHRDTNIKELFRHFWTRRDAVFVRSFFERWYKEAFETELPEIRKVARMIKKHLENILTYFECFITNAASEGLNSKIQVSKANARGFRNFENFRVSILFFCGKLDL